MTAKNMQNLDMNMALSTDANPRLKWTPELHRRFVDAVVQLGGTDKATPKSLMRVMGIEGLTLYQLKSHLQKYRLGKSQHSETCTDNDREGSTALQMQLKVQIYEQIEVQRHLELRIEAQGKYVQSVLEKAQDTLSGYNSTSVEVKMAKAELFQLFSVVDNDCINSSSRVSTDIRNSIFQSDGNKSLSGTKCSLQSSLTSCESSNGENQQKLETNDSTNNMNSNSVNLADGNASREDKS